MQLSDILGMTLATGLLCVTELLDCIDRRNCTSPNAQHAEDRDSLVWNSLDCYLSWLRKGEP